MGLIVAFYRRYKAEHKDKYVAARAQESPLATLDFTRPISQMSERESPPPPPQSQPQSQPEKSNRTDRDSDDTSGGSVSNYGSYTVNLNDVNIGNGLDVSRL